MSRSSLLVEPAYHTGPTYPRTSGSEVADLARLVDFGPDPEQELVLDDMFGTDVRGRSASFEVVVVGPRQNIKTGTLKMAALGWLFITDQQLVVWSAHEFSTAQRAFREMCELVESNDWLTRRVKRIYRGNGDESIELMSGQQLLFKARTLRGGRGLSGDKVVLDEGFALHAFHLGTLLPTLTARPDPQVVVTSSAGTAGAVVLRAMRDRGRAATSPRMTYVEWGDERGGCEADDCDHATTAVGCAMDDEQRWARVNTALGRRVSLETLRDLRQSLPPEEFGREHMGWWDEPAETDPAVNVPKWESLGSRDAAFAEPARVVLSLAVSNDRRWGVVGVAGAAEDGRVLLMVHSGRGTAWLVEEVVRLQAKHSPVDVALDPASQAGALIPDLEAAGVEPYLMSGRDMGQACGGFLNGVDEARFVHLRQVELDSAVVSARTRDYGDAQRWDSRTGTDTSPLVAVTVAAHRYAKTTDSDYDVLDSVL